MKIGRLAVIFALLVSTALIAHPLAAQEQEATTATKDQIRPEEKLVVVWTSGDRDVALKMVFMYTYNATTARFGWWEDVTLVVWGPSSKLLSEDQELQEYIVKMKKAGVTLEACKACSDMYEVSDSLRELGVDVKYMGDVLTEYIKEDRHVLTF